MGSYEVLSLDLLLFDWLAELVFLEDSERPAITRVAVADVVDTLHRLDISRKVVSLRPIGTIKG